MKRIVSYGSFHDADAAFDVIVSVCTVAGVGMVVLTGNDGSRLKGLVGDVALF